MKSQEELNLNIKRWGAEDSSSMAWRRESADRDFEVSTITIPVSNYKYTLRGQGEKHLKNQMPMLELKIAAANIKCFLVGPLVEGETNELVNWKVEQQELLICPPGIKKKCAEARGPWNSNTHPLFTPGPGKRRRKIKGGKVFKEMWVNPSQI